MAPVLAFSPLRDPTAMRDPSEDRDTDEPNLSPSLSPSMSPPIWVQVAAGDSGDPGEGAGASCNEIMRTTPVYEAKFVPLGNVTSYLQQESLQGSTDILEIFGGKGGVTKIALGSYGVVVTSS